MPLCRSPSRWSRADLLQVLRLPGCATPTATTFDHSFTLGPNLRLFFFDSQGSSKSEHDGVAPAAVAGYEQLSATAALREEAARGVVGLSYFHIPLREYGDDDARIVAGHLDALAEMRPEGFSGRMIGCPKENTGLYDAMRRESNVLSVFVGHDHYHDAVMRKADGGPFLCYGRVTAFSPPADFEGAGGALPFQRGGRVVEVSEGGAVETWVVTVDGEEPGSRTALSQGDAQRGRL